MSSLAQLQRDFHTYVLTGADNLRSDVVEDDIASAGRRLDIYHQAYRLRLAEVLRNDFPGLRHLMGPDAFDEMVRAYVEVSPSPHFNVRWYGDRLTAFLRDVEPYSRSPGLAEMAALEWNMTLAFDAVDEPLTALDDVATLAPGHWPLMRLVFARSLHRSEIHWNVAPIRLAVDVDGDAPVLGPLPERRTHAVWRADFGVRHRTLETDEACALAAAIEGACFAELCELLCQWHSEEAVAMRAAELLKRWILDHWIVALLTGTDGDSPS